MKPINAEECSNLDEIRFEIDRIDREIISNIGKRFKYVKAAAKFKSGESGVKAPDRVKTMLEERRALAEEEGLNPDVIEKLYKDLIAYFISEELKDWRGK